MTEDSVQSNKPLLDRNILEELKDCMGENFPLVIKAFCESSTKHVAQIKQCFAQEPVSYSQVADSAHALKSISSQIGASLIASIANELEKGAQDAGISGGNKKTLMALCMDLDAHLPELITLLERES